MDAPLTFRAIVDLWPSSDALAIAIGAKLETVRKWRQRDSIPAEWWLRIIDATADQLGKRIALEQMAAMASRKPVSPERAEALRQGIG